MNERDLSLDDPDTLTRGEWAARVPAPPPETRSPALTAVAEALTVRPGWQAKANCRGMDTSLFFPKQGEVMDPVVRDTCAACVVREDCETFGMYQPAGIWGGWADRQRRRIRADRSRRRVNGGMREAS